MSMSVEQLWLEWGKAAAEGARAHINNGTNPPADKDWFDVIIDGAERIYRRTPGTN